MTREEAKKKIYEQWQEFLENNIDYAGISEAYKMAIKALEQEPCEDAISRQAVKDKYEECLVNNLKDNNRGIDLSKYAEEPYKAFCEFMDSIPPINPQEKTGHWIYRGQDTYECSECGKNHYGNYGTPCCENCGAKMVEPQERSDKE